MTPKEAMELIEYELPFTSGVVEDALNILRTCADKQTPKKPKRAMENIRYTQCYTCPNCQKIFIGAGVASCCYHCGQALDWSDEDDR